MFIGKVVGHVVSTKKEESLTGYKLMVIKVRNKQAKDSFTQMVAVDLVGAGIGEDVLISTGSSARAVSGQPNSPIDATIVGIIDTYED